MIKKLSHIFFQVTVAVIIFLMTSCAYKLSKNEAHMPGNVQSVYIPAFKNVGNTEPGAEIYFTNAIKSEALKSKIVRLVDEENLSEGTLLGRVLGVDVSAADSVIESKDDSYLPTENVLSTAYTVYVTIELTLKRSKSSEILWSGTFKQARNYSAPQITLPVINTANNLYNQSAKRQTLDAISKELMQAAFDRMLESF